MTQWLRQSTASQEILLGPFLDSTDGNTQETALTIANTDIKLWKEGATTEASKNSGGATHIANGRYYAVLDATDSNTLGKLEVNVHVAGALAVRREYMVLPAVVYDALVLGTDNLDVSTIQLAGQTITAGAGVTFPTSVASPTNITAGTIATVTNLTNLPSIPANWLTAAGIAATALNGKGDWLSAAGVAGAVWNAATASYGTAGTYGLLIETNLDAQVSTVGGGSLTLSTIADAVWDEILSGHAGVGSAGAGLSAAGGSGDPWSTALPGSYGSGTAGKIIGDNINATVSSRLASAGYTAPPTAAVIADAVWDETLSGHLGGGSTGAALNGAGAAGDPWGTAVPGAYSAGSAGYILGTNLNATVSSRASQTSVDTIDDFVDTEVAAIKAKTDNLPADPADASDIAAAFSALSAKVDTVDDFLDTEMPALTVAVAAVKAKTDGLNFTTGAIDANLIQVKGSTSRATAFERAVAANVIGAVGAGSTTTSVVSSTLTPAGAVATQFKGRIMSFLDVTPTVALRGQSTDITNSTNAANPTFTVSALTTAPASGDLFVIS